MAKQNGKRYNIALASLVVVIIAMGSSGITDFVRSQHETEDTAKAVTELKAEGCLPARDNEKAIIRVEGKVDTLQIQQKASEERILKAIEDKL